MSEIDWHAIYPDPFDAEFANGYYDGRRLDTPEPNANRHPAYRHSWEVGRLEVSGTPMPYQFAKSRAEHIEAGGSFQS